MSWNVDGTACPLDFFGGLEPHEVLYDFDGPRIFTTINPHGDELFVYQCGEDGNAVSSLVVPVGSALLDSLRAGLLPVRDILEQPWVWLVEQAHDGQVVRALKVDLRTMPEDALPRRAALLWPSLSRS